MTAEMRVHLIWTAVVMAHLQPDVLQVQGLVVN